MSFAFVSPLLVAFKIYDMDNDGYISNGELFQVLKLMVGTNLKDAQLQQVGTSLPCVCPSLSCLLFKVELRDITAQIVDKTIIYADKDLDGRVSFEEFCAVSLHLS